MSKSTSRIKHDLDVFSTHNRRKNALTHVVQEAETATRENRHLDACRIYARAIAEGFDAAGIQWALLADLHERLGRSMAARRTETSTISRRVPTQRELRANREYL